MQSHPRYVTPLLIINQALAVLVLASFFAASGVSGSINSWSRSGPVVGNIDSLAVSPSNPSIVYAGVTSRSGGFGQTNTSGIYKSTDGGSNWARSGLVGKTLFSLAVDPTNSNNVYAGTRSGGLYKSIDGGANWTGPFIDSSVDVFSLAVDPSQPSVLYSSATNRGMLKSTDSGVTWNLINNGIHYFLLNAIAIDATNTNIVYVSGGHGSLGGVYKSTDAGANWVVSSTGIPDAFDDVRSIALSPSNHSILYAALGSDVYKSTDSAASWTKQSVGLSNSLVTQLAIDPSNPAVVFAATIGKGIFKTVDGGMNWASAGLNTFGVNTLNFQGTTSIYAGTRGSGVVKTTDGGLSWQQSSNAPYGDIREILIDPNNSAIVYANNSDTLSKSANHGGDWTATNLVNQVNVLPGFPTHKLIIDPTNSSIMFLGVDSSGVFKTTDGGANWNRVFLLNSNVQALAIDPINPSIIYLATYAFDLFKSTDGGITWPPISAPGDVSVIAVDPANHSIVYAGTNFGVSKSTNGGASWSLTSLTNPGASDPYIISVVMDPTNSSVLYAATYNGGAFKTINGGTSWSPVFSDVAGHVLSFAIDTSAATTVFAGTEQGVYQSTNGGQTSSALNAGWPSPAQPAMTLAFDATAKNLYAGTSDGVYIYQIGATPTPTPTPTPTYIISGHISSGGFGLSNVSVALSGTLAATLQTDANGNYSFTNLAQGGSYTITPSKTNYLFSPQSLSLNNLSGNQTVDFAASVVPGVPILISEETSTRALAVNSPFWTREPFQLDSPLSSATDKRTRVMLFAMNFDLMPGESASVVTAEAEDASHHIYPLTVETVGTLPDFNWLRFVVLRLHDEMGDIGDVLVRIRVHGKSSNRVRMGIGHIGGGPPDDPDAVPTPGRPPL
jgi:photosystem II stability/assembly factor-like uncharacterized protein